MNLLKLSWKNLLSKPLNTTLSLLLFGLGVGLISMLFLLEDQIQKNFEKNLADVDLVIGSKGSPLQLILSSMYHIDAPTGNISLGEIRPFLNPKHPLIKSALPLSMGDSYKGYRIVGTTTDITDWYSLQLAQGEMFIHNYDVTLGASAARDLQLKVGDHFKSSHGLVDDDGLEHDETPDFIVVGILESSGTIVDQLILTTPQTYWHVHDHDHSAEAEETVSSDQGDDHPDHDDHEGHDHEDHDHEGHDHTSHDHSDHDHASEQEDHHGHSHAEIPKPLIQEDDDGSITSLLLQFKGNNFQALNMGRSINENTEMQAATPAIEINRLFSMMSSAEYALRILAMVIIFVSGLSIFISLYSSLKDRKYELALMRVMGGGKSTLFSLIILEGIVLAILGYIIGIFLSHAGMYIIGKVMKEDYRYDFTGGYMLPNEWWLLLAAISLGFLASLLPAIQASKTDISETLSRG